MSTENQLLLLNQPYKRKIMKALHIILCLLLSLCTISIFSGCSKEDAEMQTEEITPDQLPHYATLFLSNAFPGQALEKIEKVNTPDSVNLYPYKVYLPSDIIVEFDNEGVWQQVRTSEQTLSELLKPLLEKELDYILTHYKDEVITCIINTKVGITVALQSNKRLAFQTYEGEFLGCEISEDEYASIPYLIWSFISTHFPNINYEEVLYKEKEIDKYDYTYLIRLENKFELRFNKKNKWTLIEGNGQEIPASLIESLPEKVKERLKSYPNAMITRMTFISPYYDIWIGDNQIISINPDAKPIEVPLQAVNDFVYTYFGKLSSISMSRPLDQEEIIFNVLIPNGFDFTTNERGEWLKMNGNGYPFPDLLTESLPAGINEYISAHYDAKITKVDRSFDFLVVLTNGQGLKFDRKGIFISEINITVNAYEKACSYLRYQYPEDIAIRYSVMTPTGGFIFHMKEGLQVEFDANGNPV